MLTGSPAIAGLSERAGLNIVLGRLGGVPNTKPIERAARRVCTAFAHQSDIPA